MIATLTSLDLERTILEGIPMFLSEMVSSYQQQALLFSHGVVLNACKYNHRPLFTASTKSNKTRLGKLMSKAATTFGSLKVLSPKKPSSTTDRHSLSDASSSAKFTAPSSSRNTISAAKPPSLLSRTRPESLPLSRHSEALPVRRPSSSRVPVRPLPAVPTATNTHGTLKAHSEDDVGDTWHEVEQARLSAGRLSEGSGGERDAAEISAPVAHAQSLSAPVPTSKHTIINSLKSL